MDAPVRFHCRECGHVVEAFTGDEVIDFPHPEGGYPLFGEPGPSCAGVVQRVRPAQGE